MIPNDKKLHLAAGAIVGIVTAAACIVLGLGQPLQVMLAGIAAALVGYGKEVYDRRYPLVHTYDMADARFTAVGGVVGGLLAAMVLPMVLSPPGLA